MWTIKPLYVIIDIERFFVDKQTKRVELANCLKKLSSFRTPYYIDVFQRACQLYRELYVLPFFEKVGIAAAPMEFNMHEMEDDTVATYWGFKNLVKVNIGRILKRTGQDKVKAAFDGVMSVAHEHRHNGQREAAIAIYAGQDLEPYKQSFGENIHKSGQGFIDEKAGRVLIHDEKRVKTMLDFCPELVGDLRKIATFKNIKDLIDICSNALYYQSTIEKDARKWEREVALICINDMKEFFSEKDPVIKMIREQIEEDIKSDHNGDQSYQPIVNKLQSTFFNLKPARFELFAKEMYQVQVKGLRAFQKGIEDDKLIEREKQMRETLRNAIVLYAGKNVDIKDKEQKLKSLRQLRLLFVKHGYMAAADVLKDAGYLAEIDFVDEYFNILKKEEVTSESFDKIKMLSIGKVNDLINGYIEEGKTEYVEKILQKYNVESIKSILIWQSHTYQLKRDRGEVVRTPAEFEYITENNLYLALQERLIKLQQMKKEGKLLFDDIDDYINMLARFCEIVEVDFSKKVQIFEGSEMLREVRYTLLELYKNAEELALEYATLRKGYKPTEDEYRYANAEDRKPFLLDEKYREGRIKNIYGTNEHRRMAERKEAEEEFDRERGK